MGFGKGRLRYDLEVSRTFWEGEIGGGELMVLLRN